ncbi:MAG: GNAT family N-acetyltransferase [Acidimicrobiia bacterium]
MSEEASITVRDDAENHRYVVEVDGVQAGLAVYHLRGGRYFFVHTEVDEDYSGQGVASALIREALEDVRSLGGTIVPLCPFVDRYVRAHPEYNEMIDWELWGRIESGKTT